MAQTVFKRYEIKYRITKWQKEQLMETITQHMTLDKYGRTLIRNLYFDTDDFLLIRRSIERPEYKEKLRTRVYSDESDKVFTELKKKYQGIVYKRRLCMPRNDTMLWLSGQRECPDTQIGREIDYVKNFYKTLKPRVFLAYEREAFFSNDKTDFRLTFDENIIFREKDLSLDSEPYGERIIGEDESLMEVKCSSAIPLWLCEKLSELKIYKTSFSKYGTVYKEKIFPKLKEKTCYGVLI